jgi:hypothetical protein
METAKICSSADNHFLNVQGVIIEFQCVGNLYPKCPTGRVIGARLIWMCSAQTRLKGSADKLTGVLIAPSNFLQEADLG